MSFIQDTGDGTVKAVKVGEPRLDHLYQEVILDHNRKPRNFRELPHATQYSHGRNPLCGDDYHIYLEVGGGGIIQDVGFQGSGCAISKSSASIMTTMIKGKTVQDAANLKDNVIELLTRDQVPQGVKVNSGNMKIFEGVKEFPVRVKCATLAWQALQDALKDVRS
ncbi:MAG: SUF system NifU family Fe-S cluster assembly protein [Candidatus Omnitrophica bacterium]|nr:SUF system NifU family Fe-S cluster assembly protein [Candidatus Omnitrophota bacterium]